MRIIGDSVKKNSGMMHAEPTIPATRFDLDRSSVHGLDLGIHDLQAYTLSEKGL